MKVLITGGTGFLGLRLARRLLELGAIMGPSGKPEEIDEMALLDTAVPPARPDGLDQRVHLMDGDISDRETVREAVGRDDVSVFHLAAVVSGEAEQDFDLAMRVNLNGLINILEELRAREGRPRLVFASSIAVFGGSGMPRSVGDATKQTPQTTYGTTKAIGELLVNDYTRKGFLDGRSARLPTVVVRPGAANAAASSFASAVVREPLKGEDYVLPVRPETAMPVLGYRAIVEGLVRLHELNGSSLGDDRAITLPSLAVTVSDMMEAAARVGNGQVRGAVTVDPNPEVEGIVRTWPVDTYHERARALGLPTEPDLDAIVGYYMDDYGRA